MPTQSPLILPVITMIVLVFLVWVWMYATRILSVTLGSLSIEDYAKNDSEKPTMVLLAGENFSNQFELPVLFYVLVALILLGEQNQTDYVVLAWIFVIFRYIHSLIHLTYNRVLHRLLVYWLGALSLWGMWAIYMWQII